MRWNIYFTPYTWLTVLDICREYTETIYILRTLYSAFAVMKETLCNEVEYLFYNVYMADYTLHLHGIYAETIHVDVKRLFCLLAAVTCDQGEYI
jgi:hypothetical protein